MNKKEILKRINKIIIEEKGTKISIDNLFVDADLDSLGTIITLITIDSEFHIFDQDKAEEDISKLNLENLTIRDLVTKCVLSNINTSTEQKKEKTT